MNKEADIYPHIKKWLENKGFLVCPEVQAPFGARIIDVVGLKDEEIICIELKKSANQSVLRQCYGLQLETPFVYAAVMTRPRKATLEKFTNRGIGVLLVSPDGVEVLAEPTKRTEPSAKFRDRLIELAKNSDKTKIAGKPNEAGTGPAQECWRLVLKYREENPQATWKEMFEKIPNHYASYRSFQSSMSMVLERKRIKEWRKEKRQQN